MRGYDYIIIKQADKRSAVRLFWTEVKFIFMRDCKVDLL